jgi:hypothetical protein
MHINAVAKSIVSDWWDKANSGIELSYLHANGRLQS